MSLEVTSSVRPHLPEEECHAYADGALSSAQRAEVAEHLLACLICRAALAEVEALRARTSELLAIATPPQRRRQGIAHQGAAADSARRRALRVTFRRVGRRAPIAAAAALLVFSAASQLAWQDRGAEGIQSTGTPRLATAFVASPAMVGMGLFGLRTDSVPAVADSISARTLTLASRAAMSPRVITTSVPAGGGSRRTLAAMDPMITIDPTAGWQTASWQEARRQTRNAVAHLEGLTVSDVRLRSNQAGGRPTAMVRQQLRDGRAVWVIEGTEAELDGVARMLDASGITMSTPRRGRPDYIGPDDAPVRTIRLVALAAYLPIDSLNALMAERLTLE